jgi:hypothetical protein
MECDGHIFAYDTHDPTKGVLPALSIQYGDSCEPDLDLHGAPDPALQCGSLIGPHVRPIEDGGGRRVRCCGLWWGDGARETEVSKDASNPTERW